MNASLPNTSDIKGDKASFALLTLFAILGVTMVLGSVALSRMVGTPEPEKHFITIPAGTATSISSGLDVDIIPADLDFRLRDELVILNQDSTSHQIGPFIIPAGAQFVTRFAEAASIVGFCSLHPTGQITINIEGS